MANEAPEPRGRLASGLAHPASLILLTAVLTGLLAPWITSRWEARDKKVEAQRAASERQLEARGAATERELEVKSAIVRRIGTASAAFLSAIEVGVIDASGPEARAEYRALKAASLEIGSQLAAYFPHSLPLARWRDYTFSLRNAYLLLTTQSRRERSRWLDKLNLYLDKPAKHFAGLCLDKNKNASFDQHLRVLVLAFQKKEEALVRDVAASKTVLTGTPTPDKNVKRLWYFDNPQHRPCDAR
jgi:hypothetical protein